MGFDISPRAEKRTVAAYIKEMKKYVQTYKDKKRCSRTILESIKGHNAPRPYGLGGYYHWKRWTRTRQINTRIPQLEDEKTIYLEPIPEKFRL
jgi:hypothetical protein